MELGFAKLHQRVNLAGAPGVASLLAIWGGFLSTGCGEKTPPTILPMDAADEVDVGMRWALDASCKAAEECAARSEDASTPFSPGSEASCQPGDPACMADAADVAITVSSENDGSCGTADQCGSDVCEAASCCRSECGVCASCGPTGLCDVMPAADLRCQLIPCQAATLCQSYTNVSAAQCLHLGQCDIFAQCVPIDTAAGTGCGAGMACDGHGNCLANDGQPCVIGSECISAQCVGGACAVAITGCSQLRADIGRARSDHLLIDGLWPSGNPAGQAVLIGGNFSRIKTVCFDSESVAPGYQDVWNAMIIIPATAALGSHTLTVVTDQGIIATQPIAVVPQFAPGMTFEDIYGQQRNVFGYMDRPEVPSVVGQIPPISNVWSDAYPNASGQRWTLNGGVPPSNFYSTSSSPAMLTGTSVPGRGRYVISVVATTSLEAGTAETRSFIGIFVCPLDLSPADAGLFDATSSTAVLDGGDGAVDAANIVGNPACQVSVSETGAGPARLLIFPEGISGRQSALHR